MGPIGMEHLFLDNKVWTSSKFLPLAGTRLFGACLSVNKFPGRRKQMVANNQLQTSQFMDSLNSSIRMYPNIHISSCNI